MGRVPTAGLPGWESSWCFRFHFICYHILGTILYLGALFLKTYPVQLNKKDRIKAVSFVVEPSSGESEALRGTITRSGVGDWGMDAVKWARGLLFLRMALCWVAAERLSRSSAQTFYSQTLGKGNFIDDSWVPFCGRPHWSEISPGKPFFEVVCWHSEHHFSCEAKGLCLERNPNASQQPLRGEWILPSQTGPLPEMASLQLNLLSHRRFFLKLFTIMSYQPDV